MTQRRRIEADPPAGTEAYTHLVPLVEALLEHGNELADPPPDGGVFSASQGGWVAYLQKRLDWSWVQETFELPERVSYDRGDDEIFDHRNWISIRGSVKPGAHT